MSTTLPRTSPLPDGLPGFAISPINERLDAVDGDDGRLWVRHPGKPVFRPLGSPELWRFRAAKYRHHGWWCNAAAHLRCYDCVDVDRLPAEPTAAADIDWSGLDLDGGDAA